MTSVVRLEEHTSKIGSGQTPLGGARSYLPFGVPFIRSQNILMGSFTREGLVYISDLQDESMAGSRVAARDVLLNITGASVGRVCVVPDDICPANVNQHVCIIRCRDTLDPDYVAAFLASPDFQSFIWKSQAGGTRQALTKVLIETFEIPWCPPLEQRRIAARLKTQLAAVEDARKAAQAQLDEIKNFSNAVVQKSIEHEDVQPVSLGDVLDEVKRGVGSNWSSHPVLGATRSGLAPAKEPVGKNPERYKPVVAGSVFYNPMRIMIGSIAMVDDDDTPGITSPDYVVLRGQQDKVDSRWFYYWLRSPNGEHCIASLARGAVRERMLFNRLAEGEIDLPPYPVQQHVSRMLAEIRPMKAKVEEQLNEIAMLPARLLAQVFQEC